jgi:hypothetical protein
MMIPGAYEPRPRAAAVVAPLISEPEVPSGVARSFQGGAPVTSRVEPSGRDAQRVELPGWLKASIFAGTLLAAMWLAMAMFFRG